MPKQISHTATRHGLLIHIFITALFLCYLSLPALAEQIVVGLDDPNQDVKNVQTAVDAGGTVLLRGTFNFGQDGRVRISKNTRIKGVTDSTGEPRTTITGGFWTFCSTLPVADAQPSTKGPIVAIHSIRFDGAKGTPMHFSFVGGLDIRGCTISNVMPQEINVKWADGDTLLFQAGIVVGNRLESPKKMLRRAAAGAISIADNRFFMKTAAPDRTAGYGIMVDWTWGADVSIHKNIVHKASRNGIEVLDNELDAKGLGSISIADNRITTPDTGIPYPHIYGPNGIVAGWYFETVGGTNFSRNNRISLTGNRIESRGDASTGMLLYANDIVATCNDIIMGGGSQARGIVQTGSRGFFANNRVRGEARYALYCYPFEALQATANTFAWTDLGDFTGIKGQVLLGGSVNVAIGDVPSLLDKGKGNRVVKSTPCTLPEIDPEGETWEPVDD